MRTFGLTGGIGAGKSTVARLLRERHGVPILDADQIAREVVRPGTEGLAAIVDTFGAGVLAPDGTLDRAAMRERILADPAARRTLEALTHPRIHEAIRARLAALDAHGAPLAGVEAALMVETGSWRHHDALVVVTCRPDTQVARVMARDGVGEPAARQALAAQLPLAEKEAVADVLIRNDGDARALEASVDAAWAALQEKLGLG